MAQIPTSNPGPSSDLQVYVPDVDLHQARTVMGSLELMSDMVGQHTILGLVLNQARNEIASLALSVEQATAAERRSTPLRKAA